MADDLGKSPRTSGDGWKPTEEVVEGEEAEQLKVDDENEDVHPTCYNHFVTVMAIWNVTIGTSLYTMPWAMDRAGLILGIIVQCFMGALVYYSCYRVVRHQPDASEQYSSHVTHVYCISDTTNVNWLMNFLVASFGQNFF